MLKFFWEEDYVLFRLVKYLEKNRKNISRVILNGPFSPMDRLAPVSPITRVLNRYLAVKVTLEFVEEFVKYLLFCHLTVNVFFYFIIS